MPTTAKWRKRAIKTLLSIRMKRGKKCKGCSELILSKTCRKSISIETSLLSSILRWSPLRRIRWAWKISLCKQDRSLRKRHLLAVIRTSVRLQWIQKLQASLSHKVRCYSHSSMRKDQKLFLRLVFVLYCKIRLSVRETLKRESVWIMTR